MEVFLDFLIDGAYTVYAMKRLFKLFVLFLLSCKLVATDIVSEYTVSAPMDWSLTQGTYKTLPIQQFNPSLGTLTNVLVSLEFGFTNNLYSMSAPSQTYPYLHYEIDFNLSVYLVDGSTTNLLAANSLSINDTPYFGFVTNLPYFYWVTNFLNDIEITSLSFNSNLNKFVGVGTVPFIAGTTSRVYSVLSDVGGVGYKSDAIVHISVVYSYKPAVCTGIGVATIGFWKNHCELWPVQSLKVGGCVLNKRQLLSALSYSGSNPVDLLIKQYIATKFNILVDKCNKHDCVDNYINRAQYLICKYENSCSIPKQAKDEILMIKTVLDNYNNGLLCEKHRK